MSDVTLVFIDRISTSNHEALILLTVLSSYTAVLLGGYNAARFGASVVIESPGYSLIPVSGRNEYAGCITRAWERDTERARNKKTRNTAEKK